MLTTRFRIWLQDPNIPPVWTGVKLVDLHEVVEAGCIEVTVKGNGYDLRRLIAKRQDIFAACLQMVPEKREAAKRGLSRSRCQPPVPSQPERKRQ